MILRKPWCHYRAISMLTTMRRECRNGCHRLKGMMLNMSLAKQPWWKAHIKKINRRHMTCVFPGEEGFCDLLCPFPWSLSGNHSGLLSAAIWPSRLIGAGVPGNDPSRVLEMQTAGHQLGTSRLRRRQAMVLWAEQGPWHQIQRN